MADFDFGGSFMQGAASMGDLMLRKQAQDEQARQFDLQLGQRQRETAPVIDAAEMENAEKRKMIEAKGKGGKAYLELMRRADPDDPYDDYSRFLQKDPDGNPEINPETGQPFIGRVEGMQEAYRVARDLNLNPYEMDVYMSLLGDHFDLEDKHVEILKKKNAMEHEKDMQGRLKSGLDEVHSDIVKAETAGRYKPEEAALEKQAATERVAFGQTIAPGSTLAGQRDAAKSTADAQASVPTAKVQELRELTERYKDEGLEEHEAFLRAKDDIYGDDISKLLKAYEAISWTAEPGDPVLTGISTLIKDKMEASLPKQVDAPTPSGTKWNDSNFGHLYDMQLYGYTDPVQYATDLWGSWSLSDKRAFMENKPKGYSFDDFKKEIISGYMQDLTKGGFLD